VVATSSRRVPGRIRLTPAGVGEEIARRAPARTAIVFGEERSGLSNEDVLRCHDLSALPTDPAQPSVNLAQAVTLYCYAVRAALLAAEARPERVRAVAATDAELVRVETALREVLDAGGFLVGPERDAVRALMDTLRRARLTRHEAGRWLAALKRVGRTLR
jgi:tRNA/rRNA methyltransferase